MPWTREGLQSAGGLDVFMGLCTASYALEGRVGLEFGEDRLSSGGSAPMEANILQGKEGCISNPEEALLVGGAGVNSSGNVAERLLGFPAQGDQTLDMCINISMKLFATN